MSIGVGRSSPAAHSTCRVDEVLILVRHARTALNAEGRLQGRTDAPLDDEGKRQAIALAERLELTRPTRILTSPLMRAQMTAAAIAERHGLTPETDADWIELDYGELEGAPISGVDASVWRSWRDDPEFAPTGGESFSQLDARVHSACRRLIERAADTDVIVVSHVSPIKSAVAWSIGAPSTIVHRMRLGQAAISRIDLSGANPVLVTFNETSD
jgi:broad specificity phosphatase PhoE